MRIVSLNYEALESSRVESELSSRCSRSLWLAFDLHVEADDAMTSLSACPKGIWSFCFQAFGAEESCDFFAGANLDERERC